MEPVITEMEPAVTEITEEVNTMSDDALREIEAADMAQRRIFSPSLALPPKIAAGVVEVMDGLKKLEKDQENLQGKYKYAGIEVFLEAVRPLLANAKLIILADEIGSEVVMLPGPDKGVHKTETPWFKVSYQFFLAHESGETWGYQPKRSVLTRASMGSQALGAAQSYAEKFFMRSLFKISTGDAEDADAAEAQPKRQATEALHGPLPKTALKAKVRDFVQQVRGIEDLGSLDDLQAEFQPVIDQCVLDLRTWWDGTDDTEGVAQILAKKRTVLLNTAESPVTRERPINDPAQQGPVQ